LETLQGRVTHVRHTTHVSGNSSQTTTQHIALFEIAGVLVTYYGAAPVVIERGDEVRVVGTPGDGERMLDALAYHNLTRDVVDDAMARRGCTCVVLFLVICGLVGIGVAGLFAVESPITLVREIVPPWVGIVAGMLLVLAIVIDRRRSARRNEVLALLLDEEREPVADG
jgi:hypothetical protein